MNFRTTQLSKNFWTFAIVLLCATMAIPVQNIHAFQDSPEQEVGFKQFRGEVMDSQTKNPLVFASITLEGTNISTVSNTEGKFLLKVPEEISDGNVKVSFLGYQTRIIPLNQMRNKKNRIAMEVSITELAEVNISIPKSAERLVRETLDKKGENYFNDPTLMTAFYRETIKKGVRTYRFLRPWSTSIKHLILLPNAMLYNYTRRARAQTTASWILLPLNYKGDRLTPFL